MTRSKIVAKTVGFAFFTGMSVLASAQAQECPNLRIDGVWENSWERIFDITQEGCSIRVVRVGKNEELKFQISSDVVENFVTQSGYLSDSKFSYSLKTNPATPNLVTASIDGDVSQGVGKVSLDVTLQIQPDKISVVSIQDKGSSLVQTAAVRVGSAGVSLLDREFSLRRKQ